ncbi:MAG: hypothetical protein Tsb009_13110 [Planctomycetaceae bacterium]
MSLALPLRSTRGSLFLILTIWTGIVCWNPDNLIGAQQATKSSRAEEKVEQPFFLVHIAGINRWLKNLDTITTEIKRPEISTAIRTLLALNGDLPGLDRTKPLGVMSFINPGEAPEPVAVGFLPVSDVKDFQQTVFRLSRSALEPVASSKNRFTWKWGTHTFHVVIRNGYAYLARSPVSLKRRLPNPTVDFPLAVRQKDLAVEFHLDRVPDGMKTMILDYLRAADAENGQRRFRDSAASFQYRRVFSKTTLETLSQLANDGKRISLGWRISQKNQKTTVSFDLQLDALPRTPLSQSLARMSSQASRFHDEKPGKHPLELHMSWFMGPGTQNLLMSAIQLAKNRNQQIRNRQHPATDQLLDLLAAIVQSGHTNSTLQLRKVSSGKPPWKNYALMAGVRIPTNKEFPNSVKRFLIDLERHNWISKLQSETEKSKGLYWSHFDLPVSNFRPHEHSAVTMGVEQQTLWLGVANDRSKPIPPTAFESLKRPSTNSLNNRDQLARLSLRMSKVLPLLAPNPAADELTKTAYQSFSPERDAARIEITTNSRQLKFHLELQSGYLRYAASLLLPK